MISVRKIITSLFLATTIAGCSSSNSSFRATDTHYIVHRGAQSPVVLLRADQAPQAKLRSVGIIEVVVNSQNIESAHQQAADKGQEIGCWGIFEHEAFSERGAKSAVQNFGGAKVILVHGGPGGGGSPSPRSPRSPRMKSMQPQVIMIRKLYDCVVQVQ